MVTKRASVGPDLLVSDAGVFRAKMAIDAAIAIIVDRLQEPGADTLSLPVTGGRLILTEDDCPDQAA